MSSDENTPEIDLQRIKKARSVLKAEMTNFEKCLDEFFIKNRTKIYLESRLQKYDTLLERFDKAQSEFEDLLLSDFSDSYDENTQFKEREEFESKYYDILEKAKQILGTQSNTSSVTVPVPSPTQFQSQSVVAQHGAVSLVSSGQIATPSTNSSSVVSPSMGHSAALPSAAINLPHLPIPKFSGSYGDWQRFKDLFVAIVHNNRNIADIQKFTYLESALQGEAKNVIASLSPTDANYQIAWDLVTRRYENKKVLISTHIKEILEYPSLSKESHQQLRTFLNTFLKNYRSLENLGENVVNWDTILIHILLSKVDINSKREWEVFSKGFNSPTITNFIECIEQRCQLLEALDTKTCLNSSGSTATKNTKSFVSNNGQTIYKPKCQFCKNSHSIHSCDEFKKLSISDRFLKAKNLKLCTNCLRYGHRTNTCRSSGCRVCQEKHATILHQPRESSNTEVKPQEPKQETPSNTLLSNDILNPNSSYSQSETEENATASHVMTNSCRNSTNSFNLLSTALVNVKNSQGKLVPCRVLLDNASQSNFVTKSMVSKLNLKTQKVNMPVIGITHTKTNLTERVEINLFSQNSSYKTKLNFYIMSKITGLSPQLYFDSSKLDIPAELSLADPQFNEPSDVDMLLGVEVFYELLCIGQIKLGRNLPILQKTLLGWIVAGQVPCKMQKIKTDAMLSHCYFTQNPTENLNFNLEKFWSLEEVTPNPRSKMTVQEIECQNHFSDTTTRNENGRFVVKFPLKENYIDLGNTEQTAINRLFAIERRLAKNADLNIAYKDFMKEYQDLNHMSEISKDLESKTPIYYIPHHCVEKPDSTTTKLRVVFDAACKSIPNNLSLNNILKIGPTVQDDLFSLLLRFRKHNVCLIGDIAKMYRQILIDEDQRNLQRMVWRESQDQEIKHYQLNTVTYGTASASYLSTRCLQQISIDIKDEHKLEGEIIGSDFYVDDLLTGSSDFQSMIDLRKNLCRILSEYGFDLRKFQSNSPEILKDIKLNDQGSSKYSITDDSSVKTLGISWIPSQDTFEYNSQNLPNSSEGTTKRTILSFIAKIFDPLGILGPLSIRAKIIIQKLWSLKIDWDDEIPSHLLSDWSELKDEISQVGLVHIPRHVLTKNPKRIEIHGFSDASERAYACCVYLCSTDVDGTMQSHLLCAKSRVSPLKTISLARLELLGALLLSRLIVKCLEALKLNIDQIYLWTDSTIVLCWLLKEPKSWKTFISNRVAEIQQLTKIESWNHITSSQNPADIISRGSSLKDLMTSELWLHGPSFLVNPEDWPTNCHIFNFAHTKDIPESKVCLKIEIPEILDMDIFSRYSDLYKLIRNELEISLLRKLITV